MHPELADAIGPLLASWFGSTLGCLGPLERTLGFVFGWFGPRNPQTASEHELREEGAFRAGD